MECTQKLECTQELYPAQTERSCPEQIGFLGICGTKYPVKCGPNKIGRDPQTCNIVLNLNSVSRQHAVINILNQNEFMLMDLDSANKTKLLNKTLQPYIPHPIKNGDTVQFGDIFGIFRLLEEDNDLPMTQAIDIPDTPIFTRHVSKLNHATTIPESPDVSDKDDSFIGASQQRQNYKFKSPNQRFIKPSGKTIAIQPVGSNKIDNVYWNSSKKSASFNLQSDESGMSLDDSAISTKSDKKSINENKDVNIHEMDTQIPCNESSDSIYTANTQVPAEIHNLDTQIPELATEHLPQVCKINSQHEVQFDLFTANKENDKSIFNAETILFTNNKEEPTSTETNSKSSDLKNISALSNRNETSKEKVGESDEEILFDEIECQSFEDEFQSQPLLPSEMSSIKINQEETVSKVVNGDIRLNPDNLMNCEDVEIVPSQRKLETRVDDDDDLTDCEDELVEKLNNNSGKGDDPVCFDDDLTDCEDDLVDVTLGGVKKTHDVSNKNNSPVCFEDMPTQIIEEDVIDPEPIVRSVTSKSKATKNIGFEDMATQIIDEADTSNDLNNKPVDKITKDVGFEDMATQIIDEDNVNNDLNNKPVGKVTKDVGFEDMATQIIDEENVNDDLNRKSFDKSVKDVGFEDMATQIIDENNEDKTGNTSNQQYSEEIISPFKIPMQSPIKVKRKNISKLTLSKQPSPKASEVLDKDNYYAATQEIFEDLCSQRTLSPEIVRIVPERNVNNNNINNKIPGHSSNLNDEILPCSLEVGARFPYLDGGLSPIKKLMNADNSFESNDSDEKINKYVTNLSSQQIRDVVGANNRSGKLSNTPSEVSDENSTPLKNRPIRIMETDLPNSQEIKKCVSLNTKTLITESSSESETETNSEEQNTPVLFRRKKPKIDVKIDLTKKFDVEKLPTRVITRLRKPTLKIQNSDENTKRISKNILKSKYLMESEDNIDKDVIDENISRLKSRNKKNKSNDDKTKLSENGNKLQNETKNVEANKTNNSKEKSRETRQRGRRKSNETKESKCNDTISISKKQDPEANVETLDSLVETNKTARSTRSSRSKQKRDNDKDKRESKSPEKDKSKRESKTSEKTERGKHTNKKQGKIDSFFEMDTEVRRSTRQKTVKEEKNESVVEKPKSILKKTKPDNLEQSTVYNISSESNSDSPRNLKRSGGDISSPNAKRTRSALRSNSSLRSTPARTLRTQHVLFTAFSNDEVRNKLKKLGAIIETDVMACTVLVTVQIKRTFKLLCAVGLGRPVVGPAWVQACVDTNIIVDPWLYLLKDEAVEKRFRFSLERTLTGKRNFLKGYNISSTPKVMPSAAEMKLIVECSGGTWKENGPQWICVSTMADKALWPSLRMRGATIVSAEFILGGVLRQKLDITGNLLR